MQWLVGLRADLPFILSLLLCQEEGGKWSDFFGRAIFSVHGSLLHIIFIHMHSCCLTCGAYGRREKRTWLDCAAAIPTQCWALAKQLVQIRAALAVLSSMAGLGWQRTGLRIEKCNGCLWTSSSASSLVTSNEQWHS